jgi:hypothetical protein
MRDCGRIRSPPPISTRSARRIGPLLKQEFVLALLVPLSGAGGIALLEYVILGR